MHRFYVKPDQKEDHTITITGSDVNHIRNVLRMKQGDDIVICNGQGEDYYCIINEVSEKEIVAEIRTVTDTGTELKAQITLFQGLPKLDKMELIIQKAVELGVYEIVPVITKRVVVKLEDSKKEQRKLERWQAIAKEAAKQSGRGIIPVIRPVRSFQDAVKAAADLDAAIIPYENAEGMHYTRDIITKLRDCGSIGVFIGPEGGFEESEIALARSINICPVTLGKRILRTETAGLAVLSMLVLHLDE